MALGLSQAALGARVGTTGQAISHYESGRRQLSVDIAKKLADFFGCPIGFLLYEDGMDNPTTPPSAASAAGMLAIAGKIATRPVLEDLFIVAQGVDDDIIVATVAMLRTYMQRKDASEQ